MQCINHETIYKYIWLLKKHKKSTLFQHLRRCGLKYLKRGSAHCGRGMIKNRIGIEKRPKVVETKGRFGDREVDTTIGKAHIGAIITINNRASEMLKMKRTKTREAKKVSCAIKELLEEWIPYITTMIADNVKEFGNHLSVAEVSQIDFYFADT